MVSYVNTKTILAVLSGVLAFAGIIIMLAGGMWIYVGATITSVCVPISVVLGEAL